jgi:hypothetical protein
MSEQFIDGDPPFWIRASGLPPEECPQCGAMQSPEIHRYANPHAEVTVCAECGAGYDERPAPRDPWWLRLLARLWR